MDLSTYLSYLKQTLRRVALLSSDAARREAKWLRNEIAETSRLMPITAD